MRCLISAKDCAGNTEMNKIWYLHFVSPKSIRRDRHTTRTQYAFALVETDRAHLPLPNQSSVCLSNTFSWFPLSHQCSWKDHAGDFRYFSKNEFPKSFFTLAVNLDKNISKITINIVRFDVYILLSWLFKIIGPIC